MGIFPMVIMYLFVVPILGILYKLSFGILIPIFALGLGLVALVYRLFKQ